VKKSRRVSNGGKMMTVEKQESLGGTRIDTKQSKKTSNLSLKPIPTGKASIPKRMGFYMNNSSEMMDAAQYAWLVLGSQRNILIDCAGMIDIERMKSHGLEAEVLGNIEGSLKEEGLSPKDIDIILATHLHAEHIVSAKNFPRAKIVVQKRELLGALNPCPVLEWIYPQEIIKPLFEANRFEMVDGDFEIEAGITLMFTPGHSAGGQSVLLHAGDRTIIVTGFCSCDENFFPSDPKLNYMLMASFEEIIPAYQSLIKVKEMADIVVPLHEAKFINVNRIS
jgi:N-acyl homoserine lactone hydrolase